MRALETPPYALAVGTAMALAAISAPAFVGSGSPVEGSSRSPAAACLSWTELVPKKEPKFFAKETAAGGGGGGGGGGGPTPYPASDFRVRTVARYPSSAGAAATTTSAQALNAAQPMPTAIHFYDST